MDKEGLLALADRIETETDKKFELNYHQFCFIGWSGLTNSLDFAEKFGLSYPAAKELCLDFPEELGGGDREIPVKVLRELVETGQVNWPREEE